MGMDPEPVHVEIGHLHKHRRRGAAFCDALRQQLRREKMRAHDRMGREARNLIVEPARVQPLDTAANSSRHRTGRGGIGALIEIRPHQGEMFDQLDVGVRVKFTKPCRHQVHDIHVRDGQLREGAFRGRAQRLRRPHVAGTC